MSKSYSIATPHGHGNSGSSARLPHPRSPREQAKCTRYWLNLSALQLCRTHAKVRDLEGITRDAVGELRSIGYTTVAQAIEARLDATLFR